MSSQYPKDEFDRAGEDMPVGMHRPQPSKWKAVIPFLLILVLVPLLGWGANHLLTSRGVVPGAESDRTTSQSSQPASGAQSARPSDDVAASPQSSEPAAPETTPTEASTPEAPTPTETAAPSVDHNVAISVLNGTGRAGLAAQKATALNNAGFAGTTAANASGWKTTTSTVYYRDPDLEATAQAVAQTLGISNVVLQQTGLGNADVAVILK